MTFRSPPAVLGTTVGSNPAGPHRALWSALCIAATLAASLAPSGLLRAQARLPHFVRDVYAFEVLDETGTPYEHPLLGGLNLPRPQLVDIDGDGDRDLFLQEYTGDVMYFEHVAGEAGPRFRWRTDRFQNLDVGEWYLFVDIDGDGDPDLLGEERFSKVRYFRNEGTASRPELRLLANELHTAAGEALFSDRQNIPKVADLDCNGRLDLLIGKVEGTVTRYEMSGTDPRGAPVFRHLKDRFEGIEIIGQVLGGPPGGIRRRPTMHGANTMALEDYDGDGDLDLFWGDFFEPGLLLIENRGSCHNPSLRSAPQPFPRNAPVKTSGYNAPAFGDLDGDSDADLLIGVLGGAYNPNDTSVDNLLYLEQTARRRYQLRTRRFLSQLDVGSESAPALVDIDGDSDLDLFIGNKIQPGDTHAGRLFFFENIGNPATPRLQLRGPVPGLDTAYHYAPAFGDLDGDGDYDMLLGSWSDELQYLRNDGTRQQARWVVADPAIVKLTRGRNATPSLGDVDGDGDLDLFVGESSGELNFYRNVGGPGHPAFELVSDKYLGLDVGRRSAPTLVDLDGDSDLDLVVGSEAEGLVLVRNVGSATEPRFDEPTDLGVAVFPFATPVFADVDGDGRDDLLAGGVGGGLAVYLRTGDASGMARQQPLAAHGEGFP